MHRQLVILRHGEASMDGASDRLRVLTARGRDDATRAGNSLRSIEFDRVLCSSANRTQETSEQLGFDVEIEFLDELYLAPLSALQRLIESQNKEHVALLVIGHNPGLSELAARLGSDRGLYPSDAVVFRGECDEWGHLSQVNWSVEVVASFNGS